MRSGRVVVIGGGRQRQQCEAILRGETAGIHRRYNSGQAFVACCATCYKDTVRLRILLAALEPSHVIGDMDIPGLRLHALKGVQRGRWSVWVDGNWRLTFGFHGGHAHAVDYEDYH